MFKAIKKYIHKIEVEQQRKAKVAVNQLFEDIKHTKNQQEKDKVIRKFVNRNF